MTTEIRIQTVEIDEKALAIAWLADGKPISWERLKWIVYEARAISQNRNKHSENIEWPTSQEISDAGERCRQEVIRQRTKT